MMMNREDQWIHRIETKLKVINITFELELVDRVHSVNGLLAQKGFSVFFSTT